MALFIGSIVVHVTDFPRAVAFWSAALGYVVRGQNDAVFDPVTDWVLLTDPQRRWTNLSLQLDPEPRRERQRMHLDLYAQDQPAEVARLEALGATRAPRNYDGDEDFIVLVDPDGNEFCVVQATTTHE